MCKDSRYVKDTRRRRYICACGTRFTTSEFITHFEKDSGRKGSPRSTTTAERFLRKQGLDVFQQAMKTMIEKGTLP